jgi:hypothetical protein
MTATCRDIVTLALKLARVTRSPTAAEADDGLTCLQALYDGWVATGLFGQLEDLYLDGDDTALEGKRYFVASGVTLTAATSVYVDTDGSTRQPRDLALYESVTAAGVRSVLLYDRSAWVELTGLTLNSTAPLAVRGQAGLAAALATSGGFAAMFGPVDDPAVRMLAIPFLTGLSYKLGTTRNRADGPDYF